MSKERIDYATKVLCGPRGGIIVVDDFDQAINFINLYAPEHLQIHSSKPDKYLSKIKNAGEIMLGEYAPMSIANFALGPNNVIPTNSWSRTKSPLGVHDFLKSTSIGKIDKNGYEKLAPFANKFAKYEGFDAHANAVSSLRIDAMKK
jgi:histidinol dehydrogenase